jgi:hypothetical protein
MGQWETGMDKDKKILYIHMKLLLCLTFANVVSVIIFNVTAGNFEVADIYTSGQCL